ncbi:hypothetical protein [Ralstonia sp. UBA689]|uniref:hypothetical protein n=1 Tax=Ralstonia sp. UBA689 TaxID=1947373 RepID=UPI0025DB7EDF|nr:hypothetical protein [Ralstonia sp. UBA689]
MCIDARAARCVSKKTMRGCDNVREFFARSHAIDALHVACIDVLSVSDDVDNVPLMRASLARDARCDCDGQHRRRLACTCRKSCAAHRTRDRRDDDARRGELHRRIRIDVDAKRRTTIDAHVDKLVSEHINEHGAQMRRRSDARMR